MPFFFPLPILAILLAVQPALGDWNQFGISPGGSRSRWTEGPVRRVPPYELDTLTDPPPGWGASVSNSGNLGLSLNYSSTGFPTATKGATVAVGPRGQIVSTALLGALAFGVDGSFLWGYAHGGVGASGVNNTVGTNAASCGTASPVISDDGVVYFGCGGDLVALAVSNGTHLWTRSVGGSYLRQVCVGDDQAVVAIGNVTRVFEASGAERFTVAGDMGCAVLGPRLFVSTNGGGVVPVVNAFLMSTGVLDWTYTFGTAWGDKCRPGVDTDNVYHGWQYFVGLPAAGPSDTHLFRSGGPTDDYVYSPVFQGPRVIAARRAAGEVRAYSKSDGNLDWSYAAGSNCDSNPVVSGDGALVYVAVESGDDLRALNASTGELVWSHGHGYSANVTDRSPSAVELPDGSLIRVCNEFVFHVVPYSIVHWDAARVVARPSPTVFQLSLRRSGLDTASKFSVDIAATAGTPAADPFFILLNSTVTFHPGDTVKLISVVIPAGVLEDSAEGGPARRFALWVSNLVPDLDVSAAAAGARPHIADYPHNYLGVAIEGGAVSAGDVPTEDLVIRHRHHISEGDPGGDAATMGVSMGAAHTCARLGPHVFCFGINADGQLGLGHTGSIGDHDGEIASLAPIRFAGTEAAVEVAAGDYHTCVLFSNGGVRCFGKNNRGQLGMGTVDSFGGGPGGMEALGFVGFSDDGVPAIQLSAGLEYTCVLFANGRLRCFGNGEYGRCGTGNNDYFGDEPGEMSVLEYVNFPDDGVPATQVSGHHQQTCVLFANGRVRCFGNNASGQCGSSISSLIGDDPGEMSVLEYIDFSDDGVAAVQVSTGRHHSCVLFANGGVRCFGGGGYGYLGINATEAIGNDPGEMPALGYIDFSDDGMSAVHVAAGHYCTCAVFSGGGVRCFGWGDKGRTGQGSTDIIGDDYGEIQTLGYLDFTDDGSAATLVSSGLLHQCVVFSNRGIRCFGPKFNGRIGTYPADTSNIGDEPGEIRALDYIELRDPMYQSASPSHAGAGEPLVLRVTGDGFDPGGAYTCTLESGTHKKVDAAAVKVLSSTSLECVFDSAATLALGAQTALLTLLETSPRQVILPFTTAQSSVTIVPLAPSANITDATDTPCREAAASLGPCDFWTFGSLRSLVQADGSLHGCMCQCCAPVARGQPQRCQWTGMRGIDGGAGGPTPHRRLTEFIRVSEPRFTAGAGRCGDGFASRTANACDALHVPPVVAQLVADEQCDDGNNVDGDGCSSTCKWE